jgi:hypothetical protein
MHTATQSHLTTLGGQHGQESEEGEERSEEVCEEGLEEEEVTLAFERMSASLMPARHEGLQATSWRKPPSP